MPTQQEVLARFRALFVHREDRYFRYDSGAWERVRGAITERVVYAHLTRRECIALAPAWKWALKWAAINFNAHGIPTKATLHDDVLGTLDNLERHGLSGHTVESRRGYHVWVFLEEPCSAKATEVLLTRLVAGEYEVYAGESPIRLPLGVHHEDRTLFCCFLDREFQPIDDQRNYLVNVVTPVSADVLQDAYELSMASGDDH